MTPEAKPPATIQQVCEHLQSEILRLDAKCTALKATLGALAQQLGLNSQDLLDKATGLENQIHSERLLRISTLDKGLAATLDKRDQHGSELLPTPLPRKPEPPATEPEKD
jgi:hypothetical protein